MGTSQWHEGLCLERGQSNPHSSVLFVYQNCKENRVVGYFDKTAHYRNPAGADSRR